MAETSKQVKNDVRRKLLKSLAVGGGVVAGSGSFPERWARPVVDSVLLPAHALTSSGTIVLTDVLLEGVYSGEQQAAGPFFSEQNLFGVQFPQQPAELEITSTEIIYRVGGEESRFPHGMNTLTEDGGLALRSSGNTGIARRISQLLVPAAHAGLDIPVRQVLIEARIVSTTLINNRDISIGQDIRPGIERSVFAIRFMAQANVQCPTDGTVPPGGSTVLLGGLTIDTSRSSTIDVPSVPDLLRVPGVGGLFRSNARAVNRTELCIFITPRIINPE